MFEWRPVIYKYTELLTRGPRGDRVAMPGDSGLFKRLEDTLDMAQTCIGTPPLHGAPPSLRLSPQP